MKSRELRWKKAKIKMEMEAYDETTLTDVCGLKKLIAQAYSRKERFKDFHE